MSKIPLQLSGGEAGPQRTQRPQPAPTPVSGWLAVVFGLLGIFGPTLFFTPLAFIFSFIAIFRGQGGLGFVGLILVAGGILTSPIIMGLMGLGAMFVFFDWQEILKPLYDMIGGGMDI